MKTTILAILFEIAVATLYAQQPDSTGLPPNVSATIDSIEVQADAAPRELFNQSRPDQIPAIVIKPALLQAFNTPTNALDAIQWASGVQQTVGCGVCFTNSISLNGLGGQYTMFALDGVPMFGGLASVYGLNSLPSNMIEEISIEKGANSARYGSEAIAGVVNVRTRNPLESPRLSVDVMATSHLETFNNVAVSGRVGTWHHLTAIQYANANLYEDQNHDNFGDFINFDRVSIFHKWQHDRPQRKRTFLLAKYYYEDRRNGVEAFVKQRAYRHLRGSSSIYGESIYTNRAELVGHYDWAGRGNGYVQYGASAHAQNSYYGNTCYDAKQATGFVQIGWQRATNGHLVQTDWNIRPQYYDDNTTATAAAPSLQWTTGLHLRYAYLAAAQWRAYVAGRLDWYDGKRWIPSPTFTLIYEPSASFWLRLNGGAGFRVVNLFAEDHAFVTGNRKVEIREQLRPERSWSATLDMRYMATFAHSWASWNVDVFYTYFTNAIIANYDQPNAIIYENLAGFAHTRGINVSYNHYFKRRWQLTANATMVWAHQVDAQAQKPILYTPRWAGNVLASYEIPRWGLTLAYTARVVGHIFLPTVRDVDTQGNLADARPTRSRPYSLHNWQATKQWTRHKLQVYIGMQNIFQYRQPESPLAGYNDPLHAIGFSPYFDTAYSYAPTQGREVYAGVRWQIDKKAKPSTGMF